MNRALALVLLSSVASAQTPAPKQPAERTTTVIFEKEDVIDAERTGPLVDPLFAHRRPGFQSLIRVRESFKDKLLQSVHEL